MPRWQAEKGFEILLSRQATVPNKKQVTFFERNLLILWSGKRDLNPQPSAWEADTLPLSYSRRKGGGAGDGI